MGGTNRIPDVYRFNPGAGDVDDNKETFLIEDESIENPEFSEAELAELSQSIVNKVEEIRSVGGGAGLMNSLRRNIPKRLVASVMSLFFMAGVLESGRVSAHERGSARAAHHEKSGEPKITTHFGVKFTLPRIDIIEQEIGIPDEGSGPGRSQSFDLGGGLSLHEKGSYGDIDGHSSAQVSGGDISTIERQEVDSRQVGEITNRSDKMPYSPDFAPEITDADSAIHQTVENVNQAVERFAQDNGVDPSDVLLRFTKIHGRASFEDRARGPQKSESVENVKLARERARLNTVRLISESQAGAFFAGDVSFEGLSESGGESILFGGKNLSEKDAYEMLMSQFGLYSISQVDTLIRNYNNGNIDRNKYSGEQMRILEELFDQNRGVVINYELTVKPGAKPAVDLEKISNTTSGQGARDVGHSSIGHPQNLDLDATMSIPSENGGQDGKISKFFKKIFRIQGTEIKLTKKLVRSPDTEKEGSIHIPKNSISGRAQETLFIREPKPRADKKIPDPIEISPLLDDGGTDNPPSSYPPTITTAPDTDTPSLRESYGVSGQQYQSMKRENLSKISSRRDGAGERISVGRGHGDLRVHKKDYYRGRGGKLQFTNDGEAALLPQHPGESRDTPLTGRELKRRTKDKRISGRREERSVVHAAKESDLRDGLGKTGSVEVAQERLVRDSSHNFLDDRYNLREDALLRKKEQAELEKKYGIGPDGKTVKGERGRRFKNVSETTLDEVA